MILSKFYMKFYREKDEPAPEAWNPQTNIQKTQKQQKMQLKMASPESAPAPRPCGGSGVRQPPGKALCVA